MSNQFRLTDLGIDFKDAKDTLALVKRALKFRDEWAKTFEVGRCRDFYEGSQEPEDWDSDELWIMINLIPQHLPRFQHAPGSAAPCLNLPAHLPEALLA